ncbi:hypothetical protein VTK26DRAFT_9367 [Humicola hyalothermophila]
MLFAIMFTFWRFLEIVTLVPIVGMLGWFLNGYLEASVITPTYILVLFIVAVLALAWALFTLFSYHRSSTHAQFVALADLAFVGALIAAVYQLRFIARADCTDVREGSALDLSFGIFGSATLRTAEVHLDKTCGMLKASFAMGIMNCVFFFVTSASAWVHGDHAAKNEKRYVVERRRRSRSSHGGRHRSRSGYRHGGGSRRSSHSHSRAYV